MLVLMLLVAAPAHASERHPSLQALEGEIMCPTCHTTLDQSNSLVARRIEHFIALRIGAGDTSSQIKAKLVAQFGPAILAAPPRRGFGLFAWWVPLGAAFVGAAVVGFGVWRWSRVRDRPPASGPPAQPLDPELERRLDEELARFI